MEFPHPEATIILRIQEFRMVMYQCLMVFEFLWTWNIQVFSGLRHLEGNSSTNSKKLAIILNLFVLEHIFLN